MEAASFIFSLNYLELEKQEKKIKDMKVGIVFLLFAAVCESYRILCIFPHQMKSHFDVFEPLLKELSARGHDLTVISHFPQKRKISRYTDISLKGSADILVEAVSLNQINPSRIDKYLTSRFITRFANIVCQKGLSLPAVRNLHQDGCKFDLVIAEFFSSNCFLSLLNQCRVPLIATSSCELLPWINDFFANPDNPSYIPIVFMDYYKMGFIERLENAFLYMANKVLYEYFSVWDANSAAKANFNVQNVERFAFNASLMLVNSYFALNRARPFVPSIIEVGGIHLQEPKQLPLNIEKWINESKDGVIYFSMGSMIKGHTFPEHKKQAFLRAFGRLKQRVLWKWENDTMPGKPDNVMIQKWMPQFDILCHPNVKGFVSHGGLLGTTEAVHCGVPVVVMPQFGDQHTNARALEAGGGGIVLDFHNIEEDTVYRALKTILDPEFNKKAKQLSERFRDRPMPPLETAIYWIEYVARHKGADHMRTAAVNMPFYQYLLLDVIAFLILALAFTIFIVYHTIRITCGMCCKKTQKVKKS
ncbi:PREDICTED: UDP-glucuronosyltransferase 1-7C-like isoform X1 [Nicrophorus vespilloides]|uniref:UDP-glucuronosyltransferase n=1 Tax=Nicrophorus vespilloides TaxID=110193 RepID=A0ABM1M343_NICVS|nr:PREDICTED: UDP-glucuronosyltransferase 1-7C-like isoform X1 [Nicrophorus vespilloides]